MLISHTHRFGFVKTRKTAGTSIEIALHAHMGPDDVIGPVTDPARGKIHQNRAIPRNRWRTIDRIRQVVGSPPAVSQHSPAWFARRYYPEWDDYLTFAVERNSWDLAVSAYFWYAHREEDLTLSFDEFVHSDALIDYSNWWLYTIDDRVAVDTIIRYDKLDKGLAGVTNSLGLPRLKLPHAKGSHRPKRPYQEWYTPATRQRIADVFHREIDYFGWTFD